MIVCWLQLNSQLQLLVLLLLLWCFCVNIHQQQLRLDLHLLQFLELLSFSVMFIDAGRLAGGGGRLVLSEPFISLLKTKIMGWQRAMGAVLMTDHRL